MGVSCLRGRTLLPQTRGWSCNARALIKSHVITTVHSETVNTQFFLALNRRVLLVSRVKCTNIADIKQTDGYH